MILTRNLLLEIMFIAPLILFVVAGPYEIRARRKGGRGLLPLFGLASGIVIASLLLIPFNITPHESGILNRVMIAISILVASSGVFVKYQSTIARVAVLLGGFVLAFFWFFNRIVV